jgi:hypothetical protein
MQAAAARVGTSRLQPVLRGLAFAAGLAARAATRAVEHFARHQALAYVTGEITLADILLYLTATFEDVDVPPEPEPVPVPVPGPDIDERVVTAVFGGMVVIAGAFFVGMSIANATRSRRGASTLTHLWGSGMAHHHPMRRRQRRRRRRRRLLRRRVGPLNLFLHCRVGPLRLLTPVVPLWLGTRSVRRPGSSTACTEGNSSLELINGGRSSSSVALFYFVCSSFFS